MRRIKWHVSPFLIVMVIVLSFCGYLYDCIVYFITIVMHELAHAEVSQRLGYTLDRFVLMPYGAALKGEFEGVRARDEMIIAAAGPLFNVAVAVICISLWWLAPVTYVFTERLVYANIFTAVFNLLPVFPLDGGRIVLAAFSIKTPRQRVYRRLRIVGYFLAPVFAVLFAATIVTNGLFNFSFALISVFIFVSTAFPDKNSAYRRVYEVAYFSERLKKGLRINHIMVPNSLTLLEMDKMLNSNYFTVFAVVDEGLKQVASVSETELETMLKNHAPLCKIGDITKSP